MVCLEEIYRAESFVKNQVKLLTLPLSVKGKLPNSIQLWDFGIIIYRGSAQTMHL